MKVETYTIRGWKEKETGLLVSENEDWILVKHIPADYVVDGYRLYRKKFIKKRKTKNQEKLITRVLELKKTSISKPENFVFGSVTEILEWSEKTYGLFEFQDNKESELFYGKINHLENDILVIDMIKSNGKIEKEYDFDFMLSKIRAITFESDYFESIRLLMSSELKIV